VVNTYLIEHHEVCLEEVIADAATGRIRDSLARAVQSTANRLDGWRDVDGAVAELFEGVLTIAGVRYAWRASMFTDVDGERFVADLMEFRPVGWRARLRVVQ
jgi:hypothetical protein